MNLPTDHPRPPLKTYEGNVEWLELSADEVAGLKAFARGQQVTPFLVLLAACTALLSKYCRQEDILIGTPMADRSLPETESLVGFLINTVVLRADLSGNPTVRELLRRLRDVVAAASANHELPFDKLVEMLRPERDLSTTPVFQVMVTYQPDPLETFSLTGIDATPVATHTRTAKFDLLLGFEETSRGLRAMFEYSTDLYDAPTIRRMAGHFRVLLAALVADPDSRIAELPLLTPAEFKQVVVDWNDTRTRHPEDHCIHGLFHAQAALTPEAVAVVHGDETLTYRELRSRARRLASHLRSLGVTRGSLVAVCLERSPDLVVALLAVLEAGGAYVPLDPAYPNERLQFILEDAAAELVLTSAKSRSALPANDAVQVEVAAIARDASLDATPDVASDVGTGDLAYVIYTSGSTGRPKGVALEHRAAVAMIQWARDVYSDDELAGVLASTSVCFDLSVFEIFVPLSWGGTVILAENALELPLLPAAHEVSLINTVPSAMTELLRIGGLPAGLRVANLAGERLRPELVDEIYQRSSISRVFDIYGPSETSYTTGALRTPGAQETIGRPLADVQTYVLDQRRKPVPIGVPGQLYIGGATVARGYLNRPELTLERFVPNPFGPDGARMYASGDLARWLPDGNLQFLGRTDHQVKLRGFRIELGEVEAVLRQHPRVADAVVVVRGDGEQRLVAYVVADDSEPDTGPEIASELRAWLRQKLPEYMVPSALLQLAALPLTPNGKVDRDALPAPEKPAASTPRAPRTATERAVADIWAELLKLEDVGIDDSFFDLGGHSLAALRLFVLIHQQFGVRLPLATLFEAPTVARLSAILDVSAPRVASNEVVHLSLDVIRSSPCLVAIQPAGSKPPFFVLPGVGGNVVGFQWVVRHLDPDQPVIGLEPLGLDGRHVPLTSLPDIATRFISEMRSLQPEGPYAIGGISFGGMVALEVAQQLLAAGQGVGLLALLDTGLRSQDFVQAPASSWSAKAGALSGRLGRIAGALAFGSEGSRIAYLRERARRVRVRVDTRRWQRGEELRKLGARIEAGEQLPIAETLRHVWHSNLMAYHAYRPERYDGEITLFLATERDENDDSEQNWRALASRLTVRPVPGDHWAMLREPNAAILARELTDALERSHRVRGSDRRARTGAGTQLPRSQSV